MAKTDFIDELRWRGMLQDSTPGVEEHLAKKARPAATSASIPRPIRCTWATWCRSCSSRTSSARGHRAVALVGGATGMVGDPSGKKQRAQPAR
jgi:tyrosyl-tRNA synthetase